MDVRQLTSEQREELFEDLLALKDAVKGAKGILTVTSK